MFGLLLGKPIGIAGLSMLGIKMVGRCRLNTGNPLCKRLDSSA
jgi:Na+/H+ antiporter NhaA